MRHCKYINNIPSSVKYITLSDYFDQDLCDPKFDNILNLIEKIHIQKNFQFKYFNKKYHHKISIL